MCGARQYWCEPIVQLCSDAQGNTVLFQADLLQTGYGQPHMYLRIIYSSFIPQIDLLENGMSQVTSCCTCRAQVAANHSSAAQQNGQCLSAG